MAMRYGKSLFRSNQTYTVHEYKDRKGWLQGRKDLHGVGGSNASAAIGENPWMTNLDLWMIKTGRKESADISNNERVRYGMNAEEYLRRIFQLKHELEYEIHYKTNCILQNNDHPEFLYSPDGLIMAINGKKGILEIKTTTIMRSCDREKWFDRLTKEKRLPQNYYIQVLHGLNVTGFDFVDLFAELAYPSGESRLVTYHIEREEVEEDLQAIADGVSAFWQKVVDDEEPALILPAI